LQKFSKRRTKVSKIAPIVAVMQFYSADFEARQFAFERKAGRAYIMSNRSASKKIVQKYLDNY